MGSIPGSGRFPAEGNGNPLQYSCWDNLTDRGAWQATVHGVTKNQTQLGTYTQLRCTTFKAVVQDHTLFLDKLLLVMF